MLLVKEIVLAVLGVLGVAIPSAVQLMTGESRRVRTMTSTAELIGKLPPRALRGQGDARDGPAE